jgi:hypothetical protein
VFVFEIANKDWWVVLASLAVYVKKQFSFSGFDAVKQIRFWFQTTASLEETSF